eukprot:7389922-Prymnesium_polylepis.3
MKTLAPASSHVLTPPDSSSPGPRWSKEMIAPFAFCNSSKVYMSWSESCRIARACTVRTVRAYSSSSNVIDGQGASPFRALPCDPPPPLRSILIWCCSKLSCSLSFCSVGTGFGFGTRERVRFDEAIAFRRQR